MDYFITPFPLAFGILLGMLVCLEIGRWLGMRRLAKDPQGAMLGHGVVESAVFALYGLLLAFTFSGAPQRLDVRRQLIMEEANAIGTAYLRLDLLGPESQPALREIFRSYVDSRIEVYRKFPDIKAAKAELSKSSEIQMNIWTQSVAATRLPNTHPDGAKLLLPAVNAMIDITGTRTMAVSIHPPAIVFWLLLLLALICSLLAGYGMAGKKHRSWVHIIAFVAITVVTAYVILQIEFPRMNSNRLEAYDQVLVDVRASMR